MTRAVLQYVCGGILVLAGAAMGFADESVIGSWDQGACSFSLIGVGGLLALSGWLRNRLEGIEREHYLIKEKLNRVENYLIDEARDRKRGEKRV